VSYIEIKGQSKIHKIKIIGLVFKDREIRFNATIFINGVWERKLKILIKEDSLKGSWRMAHKEKLQFLYSLFILLGRINKQHELERTKPRMGEMTVIHAKFCSKYLKRTDLENKKSRKDNIKV
jgi:hypothetical protein